MFSNFVTHGVFARSAILPQTRKAKRRKESPGTEVRQCTEGPLEPRLFEREASGRRLLRTETTIIRAGRQAIAILRRGRGAGAIERNRKQIFGRKMTFIWQGGLKMAIGL